MDRQLSVETSGSSLTVRMRLPHAAHELRLELGCAPTAVLDGREAAWPLWAGIPTHDSNGADPFHRLWSTWVRGTKLEELAERGEPVRRAAITAAALAEPTARKVALRFLPHARWFVYQAAASDPSGRVLELAGSLPGLFVFARALVEHAPRAVPPLLEAIRRGARRRELLELALQPWLEHARRHKTTSPTRAAVWQRVRDGGPRILAAQRLLIRRASAGVPSALLWLPPPAAFAPEDIPSAPRANVRWFRATKSLLAMCPEQLRNGLPPGAPRPLPPFDPAQLAACHFFSRNADRIAAQARREGKRSIALVRELSRLFRERGLRPDRATGWETLMALRAEPEVLRHLGAVSDVPLRAWGFTSWQSDDGDAIEQLLSPRAIVLEGATMHHCAATRVADAIAGKVSLWHARIGGERLTVELGEHAGERFLNDLRRFANAPPSQTEQRAILDWLHTLQSSEPRGWRPTPEVLAEGAPPH